MTKPDRPFVRVYHDDLIRDYQAVWDDDHLLANWLRLLVVADKQWPAPGELPRSIRPVYVARLVATKILSLLPRQRFTIKGLDAERQRRAAAGRKGSDARWTPNGDADGLPSDTEGFASHGQAGPSAFGPASATDSGNHQDEDSVLAWLASVGATVQPNGNGYHREIVTFVARRGAPAVIEAMKRRHAAGDKSARQLIFGAQNDLERIATAASKAGPKGHHGNRTEAERAFGG